MGRLTDKNTDLVQELVESGALGFKKCICKLNWSYPGTAHSIDCPYHEELDIPTPSHQHSYIPIEWVDIKEDLAIAYEGKAVKDYQPSGRRVTKIFCPDCKETINL